MSSNQTAQDGGGGGEAAPAVPPPEAEQQQNPGDAQLLVSEFPPPPYYYTEADNLTPPPIPVEALALGTRKAAAAAARARDEAERLRLEEAGIGDTTHNTFLAGSTSKAEEEEEGDVVAVFGEIVEDPLIVEPLDQCEDPTIIRDEVKRLNREVVQCFANLVQELVHNPAENKKKRDELTHKIFCMLQETNKFREHQSREILIELLEKQLAERQKLLEEVQEGIQKADDLLGDNSAATTTSDTAAMDEK